MFRQGESQSVLLAIVIAIAAIGTLMFVVVNQKIRTLQSEVAFSNTPTVDVSGWQTYRNDQYGFEVEYPADWQLFTVGLTSQTPFISLGNPLEGQKTYTMNIFIESNPNGLTSGGYAHNVVSTLQAADAANEAAAEGPQPKLAPTFDRAYVLTVGGYPAYEFYRVFEYDRNAERVYVAHNNLALRFDFPVAEENPNLSLPVINNDIAREIMNTLVFTK